jgi:hypothetical protein
MHILKKDEYFSLLDNNFKYDANKSEIERHLKEKENIKNTDYPSEFLIKTDLLSPEEISIHESEYQKILQKSKKIESYEHLSKSKGDVYFSFKELYEREQLKVDKLTNLLAEFIGNDDFLISSNNKYIHLIKTLID